MRVFLIILIITPFFLFTLYGYSGQSFGELIANCYGFKVKTWDGIWAEELEEACRNTAKKFNSIEELQFDRMNEVGLKMEEILKSEILKCGLLCDYAKARSGRGKRVGYPDLHIQKCGETMYVEVKTYSPHTVSSSQRSFYFSNSDDPKVTEDGYHIVIGFEVIKNNDEDYHANSFTCVDIAELPCRKKIEYNSSNKVLYGRNDVYRISSNVNRK